MRDSMRGSPRGLEARPELNAVRVADRRRQSAARASARQGKEAARELDEPPYEHRLTDEEHEALENFVWCAGLCCIQPGQCREELEEMQGWRAKVGRALHTREARAVVERAVAARWFFFKGYACQEEVVAAVFRGLRADGQPAEPMRDAASPHVWEYHDTDDYRYDARDEPLKMYPTFRGWDLSANTRELCRFVLSLNGADGADLLEDLGHLLATNQGYFDYERLHGFFARNPRAHTKGFSDRVVAALDRLEVTGLPEPYDPPYEGRS